MTALILVALILSVIELVRTKAMSLLAWAVAALSLALSYGRVMFVAAIALCLGGALACANVRPAVLKAQQSLQFGLESADDAELAVYRSHTIAALTPAKHAEISDAFARAYREQSKLARAMRTWHPGDAIPVQLSSLLAEVRGIDGLVRAYAPGAADVLQRVADVLAKIAEIQQLMTGGGL